jgi:hypothetical protein
MKLRPPIAGRALMLTLLAGNAFLYAPSLSADNTDVTELNSLGDFRDYVSDLLTDRILAVELVESDFPDGWKCYRHRTPFLELTLPREYIIRSNSEHHFTAVINNTSLVDMQDHVSLEASGIRFNNTDPMKPRVRTWLTLGSRYSDSSAFWDQQIEERMDIEFAHEVLPGRGIWAGVYTYPNIHKSLTGYPPETVPFRIYPHNGSYSFSAPSWVDREELPNKRVLRMSYDNLATHQQEAALVAKIIDDKLFTLSQTSRDVDTALQIFAAAAAFMAALGSGITGALSGLFGTTAQPAAAAATPSPATPSREIAPRSTPSTPQPTPPNITDTDIWKELEESTRKLDHLTEGTLRELDKAAKRADQQERTESMMLEEQNVDYAESRVKALKIVEKSCDRGVDFLATMTGGYGEGWRYGYVFTKNALGELAQQYAENPDSTFLSKLGSSSWKGLKEYLQCLALDKAPNVGSAGLKKLGLSGSLNKLTNKLPGFAGNYLKEGVPCLKAYSGSDLGNWGIGQVAKTYAKSYATHGLRETMVAQSVRAGLRNSLQGYMQEKILERLK